MVVVGQVNSDLERVRNRCACGVFASGGGGQSSGLTAASGTQRQVRDGSYRIIATVARASDLARLIQKQTPEVARP